MKIHPAQWSTKERKRMYFDELDLNDNVLDALYDMRFDTCTPVQEKCIPEILEGHDVLGVAQTGTGKTAAYLLPVLSKLDDGGYPKDAINCVIMSPTRELAQQIDQAMQGFGYYLQDVSSVAVYGGNDGNRYDQELKSLRMGADVVIATPGRLITHISLGNVDLSKVSFFILDEADRMLDMGFSEDINTIASKLPKTCQAIMFSATMPEKIEELAKALLKDPVEIKLAVSKPAEKIKQEAYVCYETQKMTIIKDIFKAGDMKRVIVFSGSNSLIEAVVYAETAAKHSLEHVDEYDFNEKVPAWNDEGTLTNEEKVLITQSVKEVGECMSNYVGIVRSDLRLKRAWDRLDLLYEETENLFKRVKVSKDLCELRNMINVGYLITRMAIERKESRGLHYTIDYPVHAYDKK